MNGFVWAGSILAILTYILLWKGIWSGDVKQNLFTWFLWAILDGIAAGSIILQDGNYFLPVSYSIGSGITAFLIIKSDNKFLWTWFETFVASLIFICMGVWYISGDRVATISSTLAMILAGGPQLIDAWKRPNEMPLVAFIGYSIANGLSTVGGKSWSVAERFYPALATAYCFMLSIFAVRKFWRLPN